MDRSGPGRLPGGLYKKPYTVLAVHADGTDTVGASYERQVGLAASTGDGVVPAGELDADLLARDASRPFGQRLDLDQVVRRFGNAWEDPAGRDGGLVVVEVSDLARSMRYRDRVDRARYEELRFDDVRNEGFESAGSRAANVRPAGLRALSGGLSWWPSPFLRLLGDVVVERYEDGLRAPEPGREGTYVSLLGRVQVHLP